MKQKGIIFPTWVFETFYFSSKVPTLYTSVNGKENRLEKANILMFELNAILFWFFKSHWLRHMEWGNFFLNFVKYSLAFKESGIYFSIQWCELSTEDSPPSEPFFAQVHHPFFATNCTCRKDIIHADFAKLKFYVQSTTSQINVSKVNNRGP